MPHGQYSNRNQGRKSTKVPDVKELKDKKVVHQGRLDEKLKGQMISKLLKKGK